MATPLFASSGNFLADRRYDYAMAALQDGDTVAATDLLEQALELAPQWAAGWFALGQARERGGLALDAATAYAQALACDDTDPHGAAQRLALMTGAPAPAMSSAFVRGLFDQYAARFDAHLTGALVYRGPQVIVQALQAACLQLGRGFQFATVLDLGCGTGLMGRALAPHFGTLLGVDLSPAMIAEATRTGLYSALQAGDMLDWLALQPPRSADLMLAADVLVYVGDLAPLFAAVARVLGAGGPALFAFTAQHHEGVGYALQADMRFGHAPDHLRALAQANGLNVVSLAETSTRRDAGRDVPGLVCVLAPA